MAKYDGGLKTSRDISIALLAIGTGVFFFSVIALTDVANYVAGGVLMGLTLLPIIIGVLKIEQVRITGDWLIKTNFIFKRRVDTRRIKRFVVKSYDLSMYDWTGLLRFFGNKRHYSNYRVLSIYLDKGRRLRIDERTMPTTDFQKVLSEVKKRQRGNSSATRTKSF